ncbi:methyl-accepting chemotaxis protein [Tengunoibacter tsumagoiensis]|uniref:Methyl-accepting chemotaxis protein n=1 Tax=Tengunoibacter tsumagoiensis TaxID=2014871 RepID=A0A402A3S6_9CHLR|nr:methyl-accepting chemotaxis protein [Tengunoibacter tsumagoiensis]GCE13800.1 hypothetical protein KTT_36590 [Tengunoibacter tsumagoiensis]
MVSFIKNIPIFRRLSILFTVAALIPGMIIVLLGNYYLTSLGQRGDAVQLSFKAQELASTEQVTLQRMNALLNTRFSQVFALGDPVLHGDTALNANAQINVSELDALALDAEQGISNYHDYYLINSAPQMQSIRRIIESDADPTIITSQQTAFNHVQGKDWQDYKTHQQLVLTDLNEANPNYSKSYNDLYEANRSFLTLKNNWQQVVDQTTQMGGTVTTVGPSLQNPLYISTGLAFLFVLLLIIFTSVVVNTTISNPLVQLSNLTKRISAGDTSERAHVSGRDEISSVANSLNTMLDHIVRLAQEAQDRHTALLSQIEKMVNEVSGVAEGDLRIQAEVTTDELGVLADSFNFMTEELSNLVVRVKSLAHDVENATSQSYQHMDQLVQGAGLQIQQINSATSEVGTMTTASKQVAERAHILAAVAQEASQTAQDGRTAVQQTVEGIDRIGTNVRATSEKVHLLGERSREINDIVKVISNIAYQTNRLALDAAIQAAMAGENGKGFGAVASDIRRLAERSKEQTLMINQIVQNVLEDITAAANAMQDTERETSTGMKLIEEAGQALESIFSVVEHQATEVLAINQVAIQQLQTSNTVVQTMKQITETTQNNSQKTYATAQQLEQTANIAHELLSSVEVFKLREETRFDYPSIAPQNSPVEQLTFSGRFQALPAPAQGQGNFTTSNGFGSNPATSNGFGSNPAAFHQQGGYTFAPSPEPIQSPSPFYPPNTYPYPTPPQQGSPIRTGSKDKPSQVDWQQHWTQER